MSESTTAATDLTSQYAAQVTGDLEHNVKEQERISGEITVLQEQLTALRHDHTVLVNMQQALGLPSAPVETPAPVEPPAPAETAAMSDRATVPAPRKKSGAQSGKNKRTRATRTATPQSRTTATKTAGKAAADKADQLTLVELIRRHLTEQSEPRSAAEVSTALGQAHPERGIKTTVVRTTLEGLVARNQAQRSKQGTSVFYTAPETDEQTATTQAEAEAEQAE
ncbi:hypothetical protein ABT173_36200 [Streptomyces sp. NPDC001795]|uniref:hypothetical protein n=1 Tax=unclassified Streptomyces TaxID=2593676 RepID=UPI00332ED68D